MNPWRQTFDSRIVHSGVEHQSSLADLAADRAGFDYQPRTVRLESANNRLTQSLEKRENALDALLHQLNTWLLCFWIPLISTATLVIGLVAGIGIRGCMDSDSAAAATPTPSVVQAVPIPELHENGGPVGSPKQQRYNQSK